MQELMLLHSLSSPECDTLVNQFQYEIAGPFNVPAFRKAWEAVFNRHLALRTSFIWEEVKRPLQVVRKSVQLRFHEEDLRQQDPATRNRRIEEFLDDDRRSGFDLRRAPLSRFCLFQVDDEKWYFIWTSHHLIIDRWCLGQIYEELDRHYAQPDLPVTTSDVPGFKAYIEWISRQDEQATLAFWADALGGYTPSPGLFGGHAERSRADADHSNDAELRFDNSIVAALGGFSRANGVTNGIVLQAAWALALNNLLKAQDVVFDVTVSGRPADIPNVESIVGSFINTVPVRNALAASTRIADWLQSLQADQFARARHEYPSSADLKSILGADHPGMEVESVVVWLADVGGISGLDMRQVSSEFATAYPLTISIAQQKDGIRVHASTRKRRAPNLDGILSVFEAALRGLLFASPGARLCDLEIFEDVPVAASAIPASSKPGENAGRWLAARRASAADVAGGREKLGTDVLREVIQAEWTSILGSVPASIDDDFHALGGTSLQAATLHSRLEAATRQSIPVLALFRTPTIRGMADTIFEKDWPVRTEIANVIRWGTDRTLLFCVASPEVNTVGYSLLARHVDPDQGILVLQSPPEDNNLREVHPGKLPDLASQYLDCVKRIQPCGPYRLLGMCTGSHIALEMGRLLESGNEQVEFLGIINTWAMYTISRMYLVNRMMSIGRYYAERLRDLVPLPHFGAARATNTQEYISSHTRVIAAEPLEGGGSPWIHEVGFAMKNPGRQKLRTKASVFRLRKQPFWRIRDATLGWSLHVNDVDVVPIAGDEHDSMLREPDVIKLAAALDARLDALHPASVRHSNHNNMQERNRE